MTTSDTGPLSAVDTSDSDDGPERTGELTTKKTGRPRSAQSHQAILNAALDLLAEQGYQAMTIEGVAERAGVGKATIYRRWPSKEELVIETIGQIHAYLAPINDTGSLRRDLATLFNNFFEGIKHYPRMELLVFRMLSDLKTNPDIFRDLLNRLLIPRINKLHDMVERAKARGEIRQDTDTLYVLSLAAGIFFYRMLASDVLPSRSFDLPEEIIDLIFEGIAPRS